jgi:hypothetical protein
MNKILNEDKKDIYMNTKSLPSPIMVVVSILNFMKTNKHLVKLLDKYIKNDNKIYLFDEANLTYNVNKNISNYVKSKIGIKKNILSIIVTNKLLKEDSKKYIKVTNKIPIHITIKKTNRKTNNTQIYIRVKTFSDIPIDKRIGIFKKLYTKYHELDDLLILSITEIIQKMLYSNHIKIHTKDKYKDINPLKNFKFYRSSSF